ncbi:MAG: hypothetical protein GY861_13955 [bacterium]|nr:hypothetical protein [bacterium]
MQEQQFRINKLMLDGRGSVTAIAQTITDVFSTLDFSTYKNSIKTIVINNLSSNDIYFSQSAAATDTDAGGVIRSGQPRELPIIDFNEIPYFVATAPSAVALELWG